MVLECHYKHTIPANVQSTYINVQNTLIEWYMHIVYMHSVSSSEPVIPKVDIFKHPLNGLSGYFSLILKKNIFFLFWLEVVNCDRAVVLER